MGSIKKLVLKILLPLERLVAKFSRPKYLIKTPEIERILPSLKDGMILVSRTDWELSNLIIPGWKHCGIYLNGYVYEATLEGVKKTLIQLFLGTKDHVGVVSPKLTPTDDQLAAGLKYLDSCLGESYDFGFDLESDVVQKIQPEMFCSGYVYGWLGTMDPTFVSRFKLTDVLVERTIEPDYYWTARDFFEQIGRIN